MEFRVVVDANGANYSSAYSRLKFPRYQFVEKIYPHLPANQQALYDNQATLSLVICDPRIGFQGQMIMEATASDCYLGRGVWFDYAQRSGLTENSVVKLKFNSVLDRLVISRV